MSKTIEIPDIAQWEETDSELAKYTIGKLQEENEKLKEKVYNVMTLTVCGDLKQIKNTAQYKLDIAQERIDKAIEMLCLIEHNLEKYEEFGHLEGMKEYYFDYALKKIYELKDILRGNDNVKD